MSRCIDTHLIVELLGASISWPGATQNKLTLALGAVGLGDKGFRIPKTCSLKSARHVSSKSGQFLQKGGTKTMRAVSTGFRNCRAFSRDCIAGGRFVEELGNLPPW